MIIKTEPFVDATIPFAIDYFATTSSSIQGNPPAIGDVDDMIIHPNSDLLSDDIWKKFELDFPELSNIDDIFKELEHSTISFDTMDMDDCVLRNHDCMWAGHCASKEHPEDDSRAQNLNFIVPKPPVIDKRALTSSTVKPMGSGQQQSLLKPTVRAANATATTNMASNAVIQHTPQTPPESDDEEAKGKPTKLLQILNEAISTYDLDEDSDLYEYFEDKEVGVKEEPVEIKEEPIDIKEEPVEEQDEEEEDDDDEEQEEQGYPRMTKQQLRTYTQIAAENDHSYYKDKNASMMVHNSCGLDTPSDSEEEEIDVVSVTDKLIINSGNRMVFTLPNNPSNRDRQQLQRRVATAISKRRSNGGIKTVLPIRKPYAPEPPVKRKPSETPGRVTKRGRNCRNTANYRKRNYGHSNSDSEPEPSEKRSMHNNMERQRRIDLRNAFEDLRVLIPEVSKKDRAAKVVILKEAAKYCDHITNVSHNHFRQIEELKRRQEWLRSRVSQLRRNLAAKR